MKYDVKTYNRGNYIAVIRKPILTAEERKAREDECRKAMVRFYKETGRGAINV